MERRKLIIVEGPQGTGKTTLTNYLRDTIPGSNLYRLSGQKDKSIDGRDKSILMYHALFNYLEVMENVPMDMIFDRMFTSEEVYARLGYKEYSFTEAYHILLKRLSELDDYQIHYFSLYLKEIEKYKKRLVRDHHNYQEVSLENSYRQQNAYIEISEELKRYQNINVHDIAMDNYEESYEEIKKILKLKK